MSSSVFFCTDTYTPVSSHFLYHDSILSFPLGATFPLTCFSPWVYKVSLIFRRTLCFWYSLVYIKIFQGTTRIHMQVVSQIISLSGSLSSMPYKCHNKSLWLLRNAGTPAVSSCVLHFTLVPYPARLITHLFTDQIDRDFLSLVEMLSVPQKSDSVISNVKIHVNASSII